MALHWERGRFAAQSFDDIGIAFNDALMTSLSITLEEDFTSNYSDILVSSTTYTDVSEGASTTYTEKYPLYN
mgnify:FL=1